jgi:hypothetical protein
LDDGGLGGRLDELRELAVGTIVKRTVNEMADDLRGITPRETGGLVNSLRQDVSGSEGTVGYVAEHAPHVEYGHRQNVGQYVPKLGKALKAPYVEGQHFLSQEVQAARVVLARRARETLEGGA